MKKICLPLLLLTLFISACKDKVNQAEVDDMIIQEYLTVNGINALQAEQTGVYYIIDSLGTGGEFANASSTVRVYYKGYFTDGVEFDSNIGGDWIDLPLFNTITGWQIGIPYFEKGSKGRLFIPSRFGYGTRGQGSVPPNTVLIFEIEVLNVF